MSSQAEAVKKTCVPLEEALEAAGVGLFTTYTMVVTGLVQFSGVCALYVMSMVIPAAGCDLGLTGFDKGMLTSSTFLGMTFSSLLFGSLADQFGRRTVMLYCGIIHAVLSIVTSLAPSYVLLLTIWSINGFLLGGLFSPVFVFVSEFSPASIRARSVLVPTCLGFLAAIYLPSLAWVLLPVPVSIPIYGSLVYNSWRIYIALIAVPMGISMFLLYRLPESPKYLLNMGNERATLRILRKMYAINQKKNESEFPIYSITIDESDKIGICESAEGSSFLVALVKMLKQQMVKLFTPPLLLYTCLSCFMLCGVVGLVNLLLLWLPEQVNNLMRQYDADPDYTATLCEVMSIGNQTQSLSASGDCELNGDIFIVSMVNATVQGLIILTVSFLTDKFGQKNILVIFLSAGTCCCLCTIFVNKFVYTVMAICATVIFLNVTYPVGISIVVDFFPTALRSTAISITMLFARLSASGGCQIYGALYQTRCEELYWGLFAILACTVIFSILCPSKRKI